MDNYLAITGLILDIIGVVILFFQGPPISLTLEDGSEIVNASATPEGKNKAKRQKNWAQTALMLICIGFVLQLVAQLCN